MCGIPFLCNPTSPFCVLTFARRTQAHPLVFSPLRLPPFAYVFVRSMSGRILAFREAGFVLSSSCFAFFVCRALGCLLPSQAALCPREVCQACSYLPKRPRTPTFCTQSCQSRAFPGGVWRSPVRWSAGPRTHLVGRHEEGGTLAPSESLRGRQQSKGPDGSCRGRVGCLSVFAPQRYF